MTIIDVNGKPIRTSGDFPANFEATGTSGTDIFSGTFDEEYLAKFLNMPEGMKTYDMMRRSDEQIKAIRTAMRTPIIAAKWFVEAVDDTDEEKEIKDFIEFILFENIGYKNGSKHKTWSAFIIEALSMLDFGHSTFEIVHKVVLGHKIWGDYIGLQDIGFRAQKSIYEWNLLENGGIDNIRQWVNGDLSVDAMIEGKNLLVFTVEKEGDNYEGISLLRNIYGNWLRKNLYGKLQAIAIERSLGCLKGTIPKDKIGDEKQIEKFKLMLKNFNSHQNNFQMIPDGWIIEMFQITHDPEKLGKEIERENRQMSKSFGLNHLEMGMTGGGAYALGTDISDTFLNGLQQYANMIIEGIHLKVIKPLIRFNFGERDKYPKLKASGINDKAGKELAGIVVSLVNAGIIQRSEQLEDEMNRNYKMPILTAEQKEEIKKSKEAESPPLPKPEEKTEKVEKEKEFAFLFAEEPKPPELASTKDASKFIRQTGNALQVMMQSTFISRINSFLKKAENILRKESNAGKRRKAIKRLAIPGANAYKSELKLTLAKTAEAATNNVLQEMGLSNLKLDEGGDILKELPSAINTKVTDDALTIAAKQDNDAHDRMYFIFSDKVDKTDSVNSLIADMRTHSDNYIRAALPLSALNAASSTTNSARNAVFQTKEVFEEIESFIMINPEPNAAICIELAGRVFSKEEYLNRSLPPFHHRCDTTVRAQLIGQKVIKPIDPQGLTITPTAEKSKTF